MNVSQLTWMLWIVLGAAYGIAMRLLFATNLHLLVHLEVISIAFMLGTPFVVGAIAVYSPEQIKPSISKIIFAPWLAIALAFTVSDLASIENSICIALAFPLFFTLSSLGGLTMRLALRWTNKWPDIGTAIFGFILLVPIILANVGPILEPGPSLQAQILEDRASIEIKAPAHRIWEEILNTRNIRKDELRPNVANWIGVPRPVEAITLPTPESSPWNFTKQESHETGFVNELRYFKWERGVNFTADVTNKIEDRTISLSYLIDLKSFPKGTLDEHVNMGGRYFYLYDTTFNLVPVSANVTQLEIVCHYQVATDLNFYAVPIARFMAHDSMTTILDLYKSRSERSASQ
jgi:hypothetical protein